MARSPPPRVELFGRAAVPGGRTRQRRIEERLAALAETGHVADVAHHSWHGRVRTPVGDGDHAAEAVEWYERFRAWADRNDATIEPFFDHHERESTFVGGRYEEYVFPVLAVAVVRDGELTEVAPRVTCTGDRVDVGDVVERLDPAAAAATTAVATPASGR